MDQVVNRIRFYHFMSGVLSGQQSDPLCSNCKAFTNTCSKMLEGMAGLEKLPGDIPAGIMELLQVARARMAAIKVKEDAVGQKKTGNCKMPEGVCFIKRSKALLDLI